MALVELKTDGVSVLIRGNPKRERSEAWRGMLEVVDCMVWGAIEGWRKRKAVDGIKQESSDQ